MFNSSHGFFSYVQLQCVFSLVTVELMLILWYPFCGYNSPLREKWSVFSRIGTEYGPDKTPYLDTFHTVSQQSFLLDTESALLIWKDTFIFLISILLPIILVLSIFHCFSFRNYYYGSYSIAQSRKFSKIILWHSINEHSVRVIRRRCFVISIKFFHTRFFF